MSNHGNTTGVNEGPSSFESASTGSSVAHSTSETHSKNNASSYETFADLLFILVLPISKVMSSFDASQAPNFKQFLYKSELDFWIYGLIGQINSCGRSFWNNYIYKPIVGHTALQLGYGIRFERALDELLKAYILKTTPAANLAAAEQARWDTSPEFLKTPPMDSASVREEAMGSYLNQEKEWPV
ncbi:uncharacterized protein SAPINGB_P005397 [Magnusiomyces paraingens]|uniref:Uncharacterized protein n=1 Tax=Magnusiomyces paraingens TaxID=2606893 RepID=A0A5E8C1S0_9ASCO|nr:uncharacterized protein SAPINGB_P005397 [Saprochaete ingens]VVT56910.1 unnamed protein product [Saprochaete ingens]